MNYVAFDFEFTDLLPPLQEMRSASWASGVHIACASLYASDEETPSVWYETHPTEERVPNDWMSEPSLIAFLDALELKAAQGYTIVSWGGSASDFRMLAKELPAHKARIVALCLASIDLPLCSYIDQGFVIGLASCAKGLNLNAKDLYDSKDIPQVWKTLSFRHEVIQHVSNDAYVTMEILLHALKERKVPYMTRSGLFKMWSFDELKSVQSCLRSSVKVSYDTLNAKELAFWMIFE